MLSRIGRWLLVVAFAAAAATIGFVAWPYLRWLWLQSQILDSGGPLAAAQAAYDVRRYELALRVDPARRELRGRSTATLATLAPLAEVHLDLDRRMAVAAVAVDGRPARFTHRRGRLVVALAEPWPAGERHAVTVDYAGHPKVSAHPPWIDGFVWERAGGGKPWVAVVAQIDGADIFWPVKDHPSDEPEEGVAIALTVPPGLVGLSNGRRVAERELADGWVESRWEVSYPINNYLVTVAVGPYVPVVERYRGASGELDLAMTFWALPEHFVAARRMWRGAPEILAFFARRFGEFPFPDDKIAMVESPYVGMEHQTLIAYGDDFLPERFGIDETLVHELAHEWWGNKISARDWDDFWIQEGFASYAEALWVEELRGAEAARDYLEAKRVDIAHRRPLVAGRARTAAEAYDDDIYVKGAWVLASLRWAIGDAPFLRVLRRFADDPPGVPRLVDSSELERLVAAECACELGAFWERYLRRAEPPRFRLARRGAGSEDVVTFAWDDPALGLALPVRVGEELVRIEVPAAGATLRVPAGTRVEVETAGRLLAEPAAARRDS